MTPPPDARNAAAPGVGTRGGAKSLDGDKSNPTPRLDPPQPMVEVDSGEVFDCVMAACIGRPACPWAPWTCRIAGGES